ncbi:hypothetical protein CJ030_MR8G003327 [Morella rubra]|uniref:Uncharacterized protein n=1 Tax=Morella rubra TaxID=262757 RepID=A0A6A1UTX9_9ROSI|nr:hypothetical protein CJ030_MR8G003327 [Morella rubra]
MAASPVKFLFGFLLVSITLWLVFIGGMESFPPTVSRSSVVFMDEKRERMPVEILLLVQWLAVPLSGLLIPGVGDIFPGPWYNAKRFCLSG